MALNKWLVFWWRIDSSETPLRRSSTFLPPLPWPQEQGLETTLDAGQDLFVARMAAHANGAGFAPLGQGQEDWQQVTYYQFRLLL